MIVFVCEDGCDDGMPEIIRGVHEEWIEHVSLITSLRIIVRVVIVIVCRDFLIDGFIINGHDCDENTRRGKQKGGKIRVCWLKN